MAANLKRSHLLWSPHDADTFAIGSSEQLKLYRLGPEMQSLGGVPDVQQLKCLSWCPDAATPWTLAIGTGSGRVVLHDCTPTSLRAASASAADAATSAICEFVPRFSRVCFSAAWNALQPTQVAAGLDKVRSDYGVLVWDVTRGAAATARSNAASPTPVANGGGAAAVDVGDEVGGAPSALADYKPVVRGGGGHARRGADFTSSQSYDLSAVGAVPSVEEPVAQLGNSESATSIGWVGGSPSCLLVGTGFRWLRMYDLRAREASIGSPVLSCHAHAKAVYGVSSDPFHEMRVVSHSDEADGIIKGWDLRALRENTPLFTIATTGKGAPLAPTDAAAMGGRGGSTARGVLHVGWCPTRKGLLSTVVEGSQTVYLWEVDQAIARHVESQQSGGGPAADEQATAGRSRSTSAVSAAGGIAGGLLGGVGGAGGGGGGNKAGGGASSSAKLLTFESAYECESTLSAACWHPSDHSRMLLLLKAEGKDVTLRDLSLHQAPPLAWSVTGSLVHATRQQELQVMWKGSEDEKKASAAVSAVNGDAVNGDGDADDGEEEEGDHSEDVLACMRRRVQAGYALDPSSNLSLLTQSKWASTSEVDKSQLVTAWRWVVRSSQPSKIGSGGEASLSTGAISILRSGGSSGGGGGGAYDAERKESVSGLHVFHSPGRLKLMASFGWEAYTEPSALESAIAKLEANGEYERAALMALFQSGAHSAYNELGRAVRCLERGGNTVSAAAATNGAAAKAQERASALRMMAMVLAGYQPRAPLWWATVHSTAASLASPHLRLLLAVLCSPSEPQTSSTGARRPSTGSRRQSFADQLSSDDLAGSLSPSDEEHSFRDETYYSARHSATDNPPVEATSVLVREHAGPPDLRLAPGASAAGVGGEAGAPAHGHSSVMLEQIVMEASSGGGASGELFSDALAMACRFLPNHTLQSLLRKLVQRAVVAGSISALCLTGLSQNAVPLLQAYIDRTSDVQSVVLLTSRGPPSLLMHQRVKTWLSIYSNLLNSWRFYHARCAMDIAFAARIRKGGDGEGASPPSARSTTAVLSFSNNGSRRRRRRQTISTTTTNALSQRVRSLRAAPSARTLSSRMAAAPTAEASPAAAAERPPGRSRPPYDPPPSEGGVPRRPRAPIAGSRCHAAPSASSTSAAPTRQKRRSRRYRPPLAARSRRRRRQRRSPMVATASSSGRR